MFHAITLGLSFASSCYLSEITKIGFNVLFLRTSLLLRRVFVKERVVQNMIFKKCHYITVLC